MSEQLQPPTRVILELHGTVQYERSGLVTVRWDDGRETVEWRADLRLEAEHD